MDDAALFDALKRGDDGALDRIYRDYRRECTLFLLSIMPTDLPERQRLAEDLYTDAVILFAEKVRNKSLEVLTARISTYLNAVGKRKYYNLSRRAGSEMESLDDLPPSLTSFEPDHEAEREKLRLRLRESLNLLSSSCRQLLVHYYYFGWSHEEIAQHFGHKNASVSKNLKSRCLKKLRSLYKGEK